MLQFSDKVKAKLAALPDQPGVYLMRNRQGKIIYIGKAASLLKREKGRYALATQCIGGGQGIATILEAI